MINAILKQISKINVKGIFMILKSALTSCGQFFFNGLYENGLKSYKLCLLHKENINTKVTIKIPHTGNTRPSRTCVIQEYRFNTMNLSQYHRCCQYHKSLSIPWVHVNTMSPFWYHESWSIQWVLVYTMSPCQFEKLPKGPRYPKGT